MKLALVTNSFPTTSETFIYNHAAGMQAAGLDVTVIGARPSADEALFADFDGTRYTGPVRVAVLAGDALVTGRRLVPRMLAESAASLALWRAATRRYGLTRRGVRACLLALPLVGFDVVHFEYSGLAIAWRDALPLLAPARIVLSCRGAAEQITPLVDPERVDRLREVFALADRVHCVSDDMLRTCVGWGLDANKAFVNRPAIDPARFARRAPYAVRRRGPYQLLSTGRLHWKKGIEFALLAVRRLIDAGLDVHYTLIGSGTDEEHLRFSVHDLGLAGHVTFAGKRSSKQVRDALEACDVYVLPSLSEGISNAALEAMAMQLPVVATTAGGMAEVITDGVDGRLVPPRAPEALASAIRDLLADGDARSQLGRAGRQRIEQAFSLRRQIDVYVAEYAQLTAGASR